MRSKIVHWKLRRSHGSGVERGGVVPNRRNVAPLRRYVVLEQLETLHGRDPRITWYSACISTRGGRR